MGKQGVPHPGAWRPMPAEFAAMALELGKKALSRHYRTNDKTVARWLTELPANVLAEREARLSAIMELARARGRERAKVRVAAVMRAQFERGIPADLAKIAVGKTCPEIAAHYGVSANRARRWVAARPDIAATVKVRLKVEKKPKPVKLVIKPGALKPPRPKKHRGGHAPAMPIPAVADDIAAQALQHLRIATRWVCVNGKVYGKHAAGTYWVGNKRLNGAELLAMAERYGFRPMQVAA